ncbi:Six-hairpin glycosidase [Trichodelitschia bisporula]|uniref:Six-hairpin glycosidase n=1 Tax=Trichodelitschia bisporula TaxID=703511 RepID=A0A6G1HPB0_9PEZI|nr:Six-hairpin glycosidase [Trichodelitschia bisporula]
MRLLPLSQIPLFTGRPACEAAFQLPFVCGRTSFQRDAVSATNALQQWYNQSTGLWQTTGWWNSANCITTLAELTSYDRKVERITSHIWPNTFEKAQNYNLRQTKSPQSCPTTVCTRRRRIRRDVKRIGNFYEETNTNPAGFLNGFYDDEGWWGLAWIKVYDLTKQPQYLQAATDIFEDMVRTGANATCGGIWWDKKKQHNVAISNELFLHLAASLANRKPNGDYYLAWAQRQWDWFGQSGLINSENLINDGINITTCKNNGQEVWSYNQGVILGALVELHTAAPDARLLTRARQIATAAMRKLSDRNGILHDPREPNLGGDGYQFKGVFMRNLLALQRATGDEAIKTYLERNAQSVWDNARNGSLLGPVWSGPFYPANAATQSSALDALVGAAGVQ